MRGVLESVREGLKGKVLCYVRPNRRSPARDFREKMAQQMRQKFNHVFRTLCTEGLTVAARHQSLAPLVHEGKGLWAFKENDHRFYAFKAPRDGVDHLVLLSGHHKEGNTSRSEDQAVANALRLMAECTSAVDWSAAHAPYGSTKLDETPLTLGEVFFDKLPDTKEAAPEEPEVMDKTAQAAHQALNNVPSFYGEITTADLAEKSGVPLGTIATWLKLKKLPEPSRTPRGWRVWSAASGPELVAKVKELAAGTHRRPGEHYKIAEGQYQCPKCRRMFSSGTQVFAHQSQCKQEKQDQMTVMTKKELLKLADRVIEGKAKSEVFVAAVDVHREHAKRLEGELRRLRGKG